MLDDGTSTLVFVKYELGELIKKKKNNKEGMKTEPMPPPRFPPPLLSLSFYMCVCVYVFSL